MPNSTTTITQPKTRAGQDTFLELSNQTGNYFFIVPKLRKIILLDPKEKNFVIFMFLNHSCIKTMIANLILLYSVNYQQKLVHAEGLKWNLWLAKPLY